MSRFDRIQNLVKTPLDALDGRRRKLMDELRGRPEVSSARARFDALVEKVPAAVRAPLEEETLTFDAVRRAATAAGEALGAALRRPEGEAPAAEAPAADADAPAADAEPNVEAEAEAEVADSEPAAEAASVEAEMEVEAPAPKPRSRRRRKPAAPVAEAEAAETPKPETRRRRAAK